MKHKTAGFTLIELMIVVAIIGILAAIAYPLYLDKVREARRVDAKSALLKAANREEQYYTVKHQYTGNLSELGVNPETENKAYTISASVSGSGNQQYTITATAKGDQTNDQCVQFRINQIGAKTANGKADGSGTNVTASCW